jgi:hypothetical protein
MVVNRLQERAKAKAGHAPRWLKSLKCGKSIVNHALRPAPHRTNATPASITSSINWSGYLAEGLKAPTIVAMSWKAPSVNGPNDNQRHDVSIWPGIGGWNSPNLVQAGTDTEGQCFWVLGCFETHQTFWIENLPDQKTEVNIDNMPISDGDVFDVAVDYDYAAHKTSVFACNDSQDTCVAPTYTMKAANEDPTPTTEFIAERPDFSGTLHELNDFGQLNILNTNYTDGNVRKGINGATPISMSTCDNLIMATPGPITGDGYAFVDHWVSAGHYDKNPCPAP